LLPLHGLGGRHTRVRHTRGLALSRLRPQPPPPTGSIAQAEVWREQGTACEEGTRDSVGRAGNARVSRTTQPWVGKGADRGAQPTASSPSPRGPPCLLLPARPSSRPVPPHPLGHCFLSFLKYCSGGAPIPGFWVSRLAYVHHAAGEHESERLGVRRPRPSPRTITPLPPLPFIAAWLCPLRFPAPALLAEIPNSCGQIPGPRSGAAWATSGELPGTIKVMKDPGRRWQLL
jgi:hypothetical protein